MSTGLGGGSESKGAEIIGDYSGGIKKISFNLQIMEIFVYSLDKNSFLSYTSRK